MLNSDVKAKYYNGNKIVNQMYVGEVIWNMGLDLSSSDLWEQGGFVSTSGLERTSTTRIRTKEYYATEGKTIKIKVNSEYNVSPAYFRRNNTFISFGARLSGEWEETPPAGAVKFRASIGKVNDTDLIPQDAISANVQIEWR